LSIKNWKTKTVLAVLLAVLVATAVLPAFGHPLGVTRSASASSGGSDPISTGSWSQDQYDSIIVQYAQANGLNPFLVKGQIMLESAFDTYAVSHWINANCGYTHDEGLMQINPVCSGTGGANLFDPWTNIRLGTGFMGALYQEFGSYDLALQAYNIGASSVANGQRNWAYSSAVDAYAQQFENAHAALTGGHSNNNDNSQSQNQGHGQQQSAIPATSAPTVSPKTYTVKSGDYLYLIGQNMGVSWQSIAAANGISAPYLIFPGQVLAIPRQYTAQSGDTLYSIAQRYGVSWQSIASTNGLAAPYNIQVGQTLLIP